MFLLHAIRFRRLFISSLATSLLVALLPATRAAEGDVYETATVGTSVTFAVTSDGSPAPTFQWLKDGLNLPGATNATLVLPSVTATSAGVYNAVATNSAGWALSNDLILSVASTTTTVAPSFTLQPYPTAIAPAGSSLTLSATAVGTPTPTYQWRKNGSAITGATNSMLAFASLTTNDSATYTVVATNSAGSAVSNNSVVTVTTTSGTSSSAIAPAFVLQPISQTVARRATVSFTVMASGTPSPTYQWYKNGIEITGATAATYTIKSAGTGHAGSYGCVATNSAGSVKSQEAVLTVLAK